MLTRIEIDGFKTFEDFSVDLAPFVVILGTNAAGKSNLFDAIQLLSNLATRDVSEAIKEMRGEPVELFRLTSKGYGRVMRFAVEVLLDPSVRDPWGSEVELNHTRLRYELTLERRDVRPGIERVMVISEAVRLIQRREDMWAERIKPSSPFRKAHLKYQSRKSDLLTTEGEGDQRLFRLHQDGRSGRTLQRPAVQAEASVLYSITNAEFPHLFALREEMRNWRLLQLDPVLLRKPASATSAELLSPDGSNLAAVLARLKAETATSQRPKGVLTEIAAALNALIPGVKSLDAELDPHTREYRVELTMRDNLPFSSRVISDGTLRVLALLTLLHDPKHRGLVCFEEPENGVHPARLKQLITELREMVSHPEKFDPALNQPLSQLLLNSHSPVVLSALIGTDLCTQGDPVLFADTADVIDAANQEVRRRTRLRPVKAGVQDELLETKVTTLPSVSNSEVRRMLDSVGLGD